MAKGPIVLLLTLPPLFLWTNLLKHFRRVWLLFPWVTGILIILFIAFPWYYLAEKQSPGFIDYFIVGEHFKRFFDSSWAGDKYGFQKSQPLGMVWLFLLLFALPWIQVVIAKAIKKRNSDLKNSWVTFLILWLLWTPFFFTISKSLIHPYIMPVMVPTALLVVFWWKDIKYKKVTISITLLVPIIAFGIYTYAEITNKLEFYANSDKQFVNEAKNLSLPLFHFGMKSYSGQFYSQGKLEIIHLKDIEDKINNNTPFLMVIKNRDVSSIPDTIFKHLKHKTFNNTKTTYLFSIENNNKSNVVNND